MKKINIGIIAHVDAGKTTLTENILYLTGAINKKGRVDSGNTQTDSMNVERRRGISVKASTTSFMWKDVKCNLIDTPGHVDFISEVERSLLVLDGVILLISAKEGIQSQTKLLMDAIKALKLPAVIFINKIDRIGATPDKITEQTAAQMGSLAVTGNVVYDGAGARTVIYSSEEMLEKNIIVLCDLDENMLELYVNDMEIPFKHFYERLTSYTKQAAIYPVFYGSALHGEGVEYLLDKMLDFIPTAPGDSKEPVSGIVFKIECGAEKKSYIRLFQGKIQIRDTVEYCGKQEKITRLSRIDMGKHISCGEIDAGDIGILYCKDLHIGDIIGMEYEGIRNVNLGKPTISVEVIPEHPELKRQLYEALSALAEEDPVLELAHENKLTARLYGDVQMEILKEVLAERFSISISYANVITIYKETPISKASVCIPMRSNPYAAGIGFSVEPLARGSGVEYVSEVWLGDLEKTFQKAVEEAVRETCSNGLYGWEVTDVRIVFNFSQYDSVSSTPSDYRNLAPLVLMEALRNAGMELLEPLLEFELRIPEFAAGKALFDCKRMRGEIETALTVDNEMIIKGLIPADGCKGYGTQIASYTGGQGLFATKFYGYRSIIFDESKINKDSINIAANRTLYLLNKANVL